MELISKHKIDHFLEGRTMAIVGASRNEKSFSALVSKHLTELGYQLWYVNPEFEPNDKDSHRLQSVTLLPSNVDRLLVLTPKKQTESVVRQAVQKGIKELWIQQHSETPEALNLAKENQMDVVHHQCIFMFTEPHGVHKFHHGMKKIFGTLPR